jgi:putative peptidoglycan lipid II flippase
VAALSYADRLYLLPVGFVLGAIGLLVLGDSAKARREADLGAGSALRQIVVISRIAVPLGCVIAAASPLLLSIVYENGAFGANAVHRSAGALDGLACGIGVTALMLVLLRVMQAALDLRELVRVTLAGAFVNCTLSVVLGATVGLFGVTLATSITIALMLNRQVRALGREFGDDWRRTVRRRVEAPAIATAATVALVMAAAHSGHISDPVRTALLLAAALASAAFLRSWRLDA